MAGYKSSITKKGAMPLDKEKTGGQSTKSSGCSTYERFDCRRTGGMYYKGLLQRRGWLRAMNPAWPRPWHRIKHFEGGFQKIKKTRGKQAKEEDP